MVTEQRKNGREVMAGIMLAVKVKKVKCTLVQALRLCTGRTAHRGAEV
jgi:hypothetical protein